MGINHLGHFYLTSRLWPKLRASSNLRIVNVTSGACTKNPIEYHTPLRIHFETMDGTYNSDEVALVNSYDNQYAFAASKLANILFTQ
mgnify:CR=1 FL=1